GLARDSGSDRGHPRCRPPHRARIIRGMDESTNVLTPPPPQPPPPPSGPRRSRRLTRRSDQKVVAGVCAGLGEHFGVDPVLFRVAFIVLAVLGGTGLFLYGLAWLL